MIHRYRRLETELRLGFPLRGAVRSVTIFLWISALTLFSIPLSYSISMTLFYAVAKINPNLEEGTTTARVLIAISILIVLLVIVAGIVLLTKATRKMPEYIRLRRRKYYPLSFRDWIRSIVEKGMLRYNRMLWIGKKKERILRCPPTKMRQGKEYAHEESTG